MDLRAVLWPGERHHHRTRDAPSITEAPVTVEAPRPVDTDGGDHDRFAHYCRKEDVARAYVTGEAIDGAVRQEVGPDARPDRATRSAPPASSARPRAGRL